MIMKKKILFFTGIQIIILLLTGFNFIEKDKESVYSYLNTCERPVKDL